MKSTKKKLTAFILCLALFSICPTSAYAQENCSYTQEEFAQSKDYQEIYSNRRDLFEKFTDLRAYARVSTSDGTEDLGQALENGVKFYRYQLDQLLPLLQNGQVVADAPKRDYTWFFPVEKYGAGYQVMSVLCSHQDNGKMEYSYSSSICHSADNQELAPVFSAKSIMKDLAAAGMEDASVIMPLHLPSAMFSLIYAQKDGQGYVLPYAAVPEFQPFETGRLYSAAEFTNLMSPAQSEEAPTGGTVQGTGIPLQTEVADSSFLLLLLPAAALVLAAGGVVLTINRVRRMKREATKETNSASDISAVAENVEKERRKHTRL